MSRTHELSQVDSSPVLTRSSELEDRNNKRVYYIGLGDRFDDDRRLVRAEPFVLRPASDPR